MIWSFSVDKTVVLTTSSRLVERRVRRPPVMNLQTPLDQPLMISCVSALGGSRCSTYVARTTNWNSLTSSKFYSFCLGKNRKFVLKCPKLVPWCSDPCRSASIVKLLRCFNDCFPSRPRVIAQDFPRGSVVTISNYGKMLFCSCINPFIVDSHAQPDPHVRSCLVTAGLQE